VSGDKPKDMPKGTGHIKNRAPGENPNIQKIKQQIYGGKKPKK
jgi:hypothetical protein